MAQHVIYFNASVVSQRAENPVLSFPSSCQQHWAVLSSWICFLSFSLVRYYPIVACLGLLLILSLIPMPFYILPVFCLLFFLHHFEVSTHFLFSWLPFVSISWLILVKVQPSFLVPLPFFSFLCPCHFHFPHLLYYFSCLPPIQVFFQLKRILNNWMRGLAECNRRSYLSLKHQPNPRL